MSTRTTTTSRWPTRSVCLSAPDCERAEPSFSYDRSALRPRFWRALEADGFDVNALTASWQLVCEEAGKLLSSFTFDGIIDELTRSLLKKEARR